MSDDVINYKSAFCKVNEFHKTLFQFSNLIHLKTSTVNDITCTWSAKYDVTNMDINFEWKFDWNKINNRRVDELTGYIIVKAKGNKFPPTKFEVKLTEENKIITKIIRKGVAYNDASYEYSLIPHYVTEPDEMVKLKIISDEMFLPSEQNDRVLVVEGKKLHVSKAFLSYHSEYFRALFSSNYKESQMDEIPIKDVSFQDFALLLSCFYPNPVFPNDTTVYKLLEMSRRFLVLSVINIIEYHLLNNSKIDNKKMLWLADEYGMPTLLEKCICGLTLEKLKNLAKSQEYGKLSDSTKAKVLDRLVKMI